jgi:hypothetical protein
MSINYHRNRLSKMGISSTAIDQMEKTHTLQAIRKIEDSNYLEGKGRRLVDGDEAKIRREVATSRYGYNMSDNLVNVIQQTQPTKLGKTELPFEMGDEVTEKMTQRVAAEARVYSGIRSDMSSKELKDYLSKSSNSRLTKLANDISDSRTKITAGDLRSGNFTQEAEEQLKRFAYNLRSANEEIKGVFKGIEVGKFNVHSANQLFTGAAFPETNNIEGLTRAFRASDAINQYGFSGMLDSKTANRMTRLLNMNADQLKDIEIDIPDAGTQRALGTKKINLMQAINTPEFQQLQRGRMSELITMTPERASVALQGDAALRILNADRTVLSQVTGAMGTGATRLTGMVNLNRVQEAIKGSAILRGTGAVIGGALNVIDPAFLGYQMYDSAKISGDSSGMALTKAGALSGAVGGGMFAYLKNLQNKEFSK